ncbi:hypothetical protein [Clostridium botulinum]|uniref:hypothetical protein n=1 Tax=Clostridium botulinum TaxID=1491 RepID=UPI000ADF9905|nr:hypothetical protein [Clostridium botulinum]
MSDKPLLIPLSFKKDIDDLKLYNWICKNKYKSAFIKSILRNIMEQEEKEKR